MSVRERLPQLDGDLFLTDGGIETTLIFHQWVDLPEFAAFPLLPRLSILGGCCGTDDRHIAEIARGWGDDRRPRTN